LNSFLVDKKIIAKADLQNPALTTESFAEKSLFLIIDRNVQ